MSVPSPSVQQAGIGAVTADQYNTYAQGGMLLANLQTFVGVSNMTVLLIGYYAQGDGGQGWFVWNSTVSPTLNNNQTIIAPNQSVQGAWVRVQNTNVGTNMFRYIDSGSSGTATSADSTIAFNSASGAAKTLAIPAASSVASGFILIVKDAYGDAAVNNITVTPTSGTIDKSSTDIINIGYQSRSYQSDGSASTNNWIRI